MYPSIIVLEALVLTAGITVGLTVYTFWATAQGKEFDFMVRLLPTRSVPIRSPLLPNCPMNMTYLFSYHDFLRRVDLRDIGSKRYVLDSIF